MAGKLTADAVLAAVEAHMAGPFIWGQSDCCAAPASVFAALHGIDPMAGVRCTYASRHEATRLILSQGGMRAFSARLAVASGLRATRGDVGDIGLVRNGRGLSLAIGLGGWWALRTEQGFGCIRDVEQAWGP